MIFLVGFLILSSLLIFPVKSSYTSHLYSAEDSWVEAEFPNDNHGSETSSCVKSDARTRRSYLKFDLNSIPNGKSVTSVKLYLYCTYKDQYPSVGIYVHETSDNWDEASITWHNAPLSARLSQAFMLTEPDNTIVGTLHLMVKHNILETKS